MRISEGRLVQGAVVGAVVVTIAIIVSLAWSLVVVVRDVREIKNDVTDLIEAAEEGVEDHTREASRAVKAQRQTNRLAARQHRRIIDFMRAIVKVAGLNLREIEERARGSGSSQQR